MNAFVVFADTRKQVLHQSSITLPTQQVSNSFSETKKTISCCIQDETISNTLELTKDSFKSFSCSRTYCLALAYPLVCHTHLVSFFPLIALLGSNVLNQPQINQPRLRSSLATYVWSASWIALNQNRGSQPFLQVIGAKTLVRLVLRLSCEIRFGFPKMIGSNTQLRVMGEILDVQLACPGAVNHPAGSRPVAAVTTLPLKCLRMMLEDVQNGTNIVKTSPYVAYMRGTNPFSSGNLQFLVSVLP